MIQVYTGNGKGKTTAALGLALRAAGAGLKVYIIQFLKGKSYSEFKIIRKISNIKLEQYGSGCFIKTKINQKDIDLANKGFQRIRQIINREHCDLVILDEINVVLHLKLLNLDKVIDLLRGVSRNIEVVLTGRWAHPKIKNLADLVSDFKEIKHYYKKGIKARRGIEF